jgi:hypothetical protein
MRYVAILFGFTAHLFAQQEPVNLSFKNVGAGGEPAGWFSIRKPGYSTSTTHLCRRENSRCVVVKYEDTTEPNDFGYVQQSFDATNFRGRQVRYRGWLRVDDPAKTRAQLFIRVDRSNEEVGFYDYSHQQPIRSRTWIRREIIGKVDPDAVRIIIGLMLGGRGAAYLAEPEFQLIESR